MVFSNVFFLESAGSIFLVWYILVIVENIKIKYRTNVIIILISDPKEIFKSILEKILVINALKYASALVRRIITMISIGSDIRIPFKTKLFFLLLALVVLIAGFIYSILENKYPGNSFKNHLIKLKFNLKLGFIKL